MVEHFSVGQKQRFGPAVGVGLDPSLLLLDEPTTGLDPVARRELWQQVKTFKASGRTVLLTTHYLEEAERLADRVLILEKGRILVQGTPAELVSSLGVEQVIELSTEPRLSADKLSALPGVLRVSEEVDTQKIAVRGLHIALPAIIEAARQQGCALTQLSTRQASLEDVFVQLTGHAIDAPKP